MRKAGAVLGMLALLVGTLAVVGGAQADEINRLNKRGLKMKARQRAANAAGFLPSEIECTVRGEPDNLNLDCDDPVLPNNEPDVAVNPEDPLHMVASSNDFDSCCDGFYTTFDGGRTWAQGDMSALTPQHIGSDPVTTFDPVTDTVIHSSLTFLITEEGLASDGDVVVSLSTDGGLRWGKPIVVGEGVGDDDDPLQIFHDKEWIVTDTDPDSRFYGRTYLTWTAFFAENGAYTRSPILESHSDDGGRTWTEPQEISGFSPTCTFQETGTAGECDEDQFSVPTVAPDGTVYVAFQNYQHEAAWEPGDLFEAQYMVVRSTDGGATWSDPVPVTDLEDGTRDYPENVHGRQTLTGYQIRVNSAGNITADPNTGRLYLVFSDNRNGKHDAARPVTNTDVFLMTSLDGIRWSEPIPVSLKTTDQWFPWVDVDPTTGEVGILYHDRRNFELYDTTLAEGRPGSFTYTRVNTAASHPRDSQFFRAGIPSCPECATFHGDYINVDYDSNGVAHVVRRLDREAPATQAQAGSRGPVSWPR
jgi:hypothetical protein